MTARRRTSSRLRKSSGKASKTGRKPTKSPGGKPTLARKTLFDLPPLELECMKALWDLANADIEQAGVTVRQIREAVADHHRRLAYTTVETIMDRLTRKGMVTRRRKGRAHRYIPIYRFEQARAEGLRTLLDHFFGGSRRILLEYLGGHSILPVRARSAAPRSTLRRESAASVEKATSMETSLL